ncbi:MFS transporter [Kineococcus arenarius]|uniref:MFS transporter n=1 Tax=unclassified Kineococcus TaxID=2621656 RepID=UPI003D7DC489
MTPRLDTGPDPRLEAPAAPGAVRATPPPGVLVGALVLAAFGLYLASLTPPIATLAVRTAALDADGKTVALSTVVLAGAVATIATLPLFGALSDRTRGRFGRRRPWLLGGALVGLLGLAVAGAAPSVAWVVVGWSTASLGYGAAFAGFLPLIPEFVPEHLRARLSGLIGFVVSIAVLVGVVLGSRLVAAPVAMLALPGVVALLGVLVLTTVVRRVDSASGAERSRFGVREFVGSYWLRTGDHDFAWNWVSRLLLGLAYVGIQTYAVFHLTDTVGMDVAAAAGRLAQVNAASAPVGIACFVLTGHLSDRLGRRRSFAAVGACVVAVALVVAAVAPSSGGFLVAWLVLTVGQAVYLTVDIAIAAAVVPDAARAGKAMSVYQVATLLPNVAAPVLAVGVLSVTGGAYPPYFAVLAVVALCAAAAVLRVRHVR